MNKKIFMLFLGIVIVFALTVKTFALPRASEIVIEEIPTAYSKRIDIPVTRAQREKINKALESYEPDLDIMAKVMYKEAGGLTDITHQAAVAWCILNHIDTGLWGNTIKDTATYPAHFAWNEKAPVVDQLYELAHDVVIRWLLEKEGFVNVGRVLPKDYIYFIGNGRENLYTIEWKSTAYWDWSLETPYYDSYFELNV